MNICIDSRYIKKGDIFVPVKGENFDGHDFIKEALSKGAKKIWDVDLGQIAFEHRSKFNLPVIAVTGSSGKTTVKDLLYSVLSQKYNVLKTSENENNQVGLPLTLLKLSSKHDVVILEMAMRNKGDIEYLTKIAQPTHVVITNIGLTHLERLKHPFNIVKTKVEIFAHKGKYKKYAYLNSGTKYINYLKKSAKNNGYRVKLFNGKDAYLQNKNLVIKVAKDFNLSNKQIKKGLKEWKPSQNRMELLTLKNGVFVINDSYNANPSSMVWAIKYLGRRKGRKISVLGDMLELGMLEKKEHVKLGKLLNSIKLDKLFTFGKLAKMIEFNRNKTINTNNHKKLFLEVVKYLRPGDSLLIKGSRGMQLDLIVLDLIKKIGLKKKEYFKY